MNWVIVISIVIIVLLLDNLDFFTLRKCPKCGRVIYTKRIKKTDHGPLFAKPGYHRILIDYKCGKCKATWTLVREVDQSTD